MKTFCTFLFVLIYPIIGFGQISIFANAIVLKATKNDKDISNIALENGQSILFYTADEDGLIYMSNYWSKSASQSYGEITSSKKTKKTTINNLRAEILYFDWYYINSYDTQAGLAKVKFTKIYATKGIEFILEISPDNKDKLVYKGYLVGDLEM